MCIIDYVFACSVFNLIFLKNVLTVNVASGASTKFCGTNDMDGKLVDGETRSDLFVEMTSECDGGFAFVELTTEKYYYVHYFVVYKGLGNDQGQLSHFHALISVNNDYVLCGEHNLPYVFDEGARINCAPRPLSNSFRIKSHMNSGLAISEIELHNLGSNGDDALLLYRGCYKAFRGTRSDASDINSCAGSCTSTNYHFAMKNGGECYCGNGYDEAESAGDDCNIICSESELKCGGSNSYSVYIGNFRLPYYEGCLEHTLLTSPKLQGNMSVSKCLKYCDGDKYALLSNGDTCQCHSNLGVVTDRREYCTTECTGIADVMCGSDLENIYSLYRTCLNRETFSLSCSQSMMCRNGDYDFEGVCENGCEDGYVGEHCLIKQDEPDPSNGGLSSTTLLLYIFAALVTVLALIGIIFFIKFGLRKEGAAISEIAPTVAPDTQSSGSTDLS